MKLLTKEILTKFPKLGDTSEQEPEDVKIIAKFFDPTGSWTWYATEFDGEDTFFGLVDGMCKELGYFSLSELRSVKGALGLGIERDMWYSDKTLADVM